MKRKVLESTTSLKETMVGYYLELGQAAATKSAPVAWCTSTGPRSCERSTTGSTSRRTTVR